MTGLWCLLILRYHWGCWCPGADVINCQSSDKYFSYCMMGLNPRATVVKGVAIWNGICIYYIVVILAYFYHHSGLMIYALYNNMRDLYELLLCIIWFRCWACIYIYMFVYIYISELSLHCACKWTSTYQCLAISRHSEGYKAIYEFFQIFFGYQLFEIHFHRSDDIIQDGHTVAA